LNDTFEKQKQQDLVKYQQRNGFYRVLPEALSTDRRKQID
jgi:hypothetical protein